MILPSVTGGAVTEKPTEDRGVELIRPYRLLARYGPWLMCVLGLAMILTGILADRDSSVLIALIVLGAGLVVIGVSFVRLEGPLEFGASGLKTNVQPATTFDPRAFVPTAVAVESAARELLPDTSDKEQRVQDVVSKTLRELITMAEEQGWTITRTSGGHLAFKGPTGKQTVIGLNSEEPRALRNLQAALRRAGLAYPPGRDNSEDGSSSSNDEP
jgi:predicted RNA binding protein YcfA (HicA-like mRNA interferase family)